MGIGSYISKKMKRYQNIESDIEAEIFQAYKRIKEAWKEYGIEKGYTN